jgi:RimJ/RimL family protein N-acetyltransferase
MLETRRLILQVMREEDYDSMLKVFTDEKVMKSFNLRSFNRQQMQKWMKKNLEHQKEYGYGLYSVFLKSTQELIGDCGLEHTEFDEKPCVEIGYDFLSKHWNHGYATEAAKAVKNYAIEILDINPRFLCSFIRKHNRASQRVAEKIGMKKIKEYKVHDIKYFLFALSNENFI